MNFNFNIHFPIIDDFSFEKYDFKQKELIIKEISEVLKNKFVLEKYILDYNIKVEVEKYDVKLPQFNQIDFQKITCENNLKFILEINYSIEEFDYIEATEFSLNKETALLMSAINFFCVKIFEILTLSQIARPGSLKIRNGFCFSEGILLKKNIYSINSFRDAIEYRDNLKYPNIEYLNFSEFHKWLYILNPVFDSKPDNGFQRALNNLTYINTERNLISEFIYQLRILENLYTNSNISVTEQLNQKIQLFIGEITEFKKQIKKMYGIRSDFIHGRMNISPSHIEFKESQNDSDLIDAHNLSCCLVISTLQKMYKSDILDLEFELKVKN